MLERLPPMLRRFRHCRFLAQGVAILSGVHAEYSPALLDPRDPVHARLAAELQPSEPARAALFRSLLRRLGLKTLDAPREVQSPTHAVLLVGGRPPTDPLRCAPGPAAAYPTALAVLIPLSACTVQGRWHGAAKTWRRCLPTTAAPRSWTWAKTPVRPAHVWHRHPQRHPQHGGHSADVGVRHGSTDPAAAGPTTTSGGRPARRRCWRGAGHLCGGAVAARRPRRHP